MSTVKNLVMLATVVGEVFSTTAKVVANGKNYLADAMLLPEIVRDGEDAATTVQNYKSDLDEVKNLDEAGRAEFAAALTAALPHLQDQTVEMVVTQGVAILTYVLEAVGYFLRTNAPAPAA